MGSISTSSTHLNTTKSKTSPQTSLLNFKDLETQPNNPLHGIRLDHIIQHLVEVYGWQELGERITIKCFTHNPSINSSLKFLRQTPWARERVEGLYLKSLRDANKK